MAVMYANLATGTTTITLTALTTCIASNPSGTITRINKTGHGLTTGQLVSLSLFSNWLNRVWSVSVVDANNFDLVEAVWETTADNNGTVTPCNGYSWATAIRNPSLLTQSFNTIMPYVEIRTAKTDDPTSIGNATWTKGSGTVTLATAQTATIDNCETAWTAANAATVARTTSAPVKQGTYRMQITLPASGLVTNTKYAYFTLPAALNLSAYQRISYWLQPSATNSIDADTEYKICLCSDTLGNTIVDEFYLQRQSYSGTRNTPFVITRNGGGNLGSNINSIALYTNTTLPVTSSSIFLDNIIACTSTGLNLRSLISKCSSATYDHNQEPWFPIDYIDGTDVQLSNNVSSNWNTTVNSYYKYTTTGTSPATVTTYKLDPLNLPNHIFSYGSLLQARQVVTNVNTIVEAVGGYNTSNTTIDGMTFTSGYVNGLYGITPFGSPNSSGLYGNVTLKNFGMVDFVSGMNANTSWHKQMTLENCHIIREQDGAVVGSGSSAGISLIGLYVKNVTHNSSQSNRSLEFYTTNGGIDGYKAVNAMTASQIGIDRGYFKNIYMTPSNYNSSNSHRIAVMNQCETSNITIDGQTVPANSTNYTGLSFIASAYPVVLSGVTIKNCYNAVGIFGTMPAVPGYVQLNNSTFTNNTYTYTNNQNSGTFVLNNVTRTDTNLLTYTGNWQALGWRSLFINNGQGGDKNNINHYYKEFGASYVTLTSNSATVSAQTAVRHTASGIAWQINPLTNQYTSSFPFMFKIASVAVNASSLVTVKAWLKLSHATDIGAKLFIPGGQISGPTSDTTATKSANTNWEELTVTFTPAMQGVVDVYVEAYWLANTADESVYVDDITVTQA